MKKLQYLTTLLVLFVSMLTMSFKDDDVALAVVANEKGAPAALTMKFLKSVVQGDKQRWPDGTKISLAFLKTNTPVGNATAKKLMGMNGDQFNKYWLALVFQGKANAPAFFNTTQELEAYVSTTPGAVGIIDGNQSTKLRSISVDDKKSF
ncbi:MAG TPA: hypothetical protein PK509_07680 [Catalimonadaceae bacterium]|nr:hypothetical protein [Catalimonadaceae bacterium]HPI12338.1 hypothetical protein [Catalimonadaceae bacterium]